MSHLSEEREEEKQIPPAPVAPQTLHRFPGGAVRAIQARDVNTLYLISQLSSEDQKKLSGGISNSVLTHCRAFPWLHGNSYWVPVPKNGDEDEKEKTLKDGEDVPCFLDPWGTLRDRFYQPCQIDSSLLEEREKDKNDDKDFDDPVNATDILSVLQLSSFPNVKKAKSFNDYKRSAIQWAGEVESALARVSLPVPVGRSLYRPPLRAQTTDARQRTSTIFHDENEANEFERLKKNSMNKEENNKELESMETSIDTQEFNKIGLPTLRTSTAHAVPKDVEKENENENVSFCTWDALLVPPEPKPHMYSNYEDYEKAMLHWAHLCSSRMEIIPPSAEQLSALLPVRVHGSGSGSHDDQLEGSDDRAHKRVADGLSSAHSWYEALPIFSPEMHPTMPFDYKAPKMPDLALIAATMPGAKEKAPVKKRSAFGDPEMYAHPDRTEALAVLHGQLATVDGRDTAELARHSTSRHRHTVRGSVMSAGRSASERSLDGTDDTGSIVVSRRRVGNRGSMAFHRKNVAGDGSGGGSIGKSGMSSMGGSQAALPVGTAEVGSLLSALVDSSLAKEKKRYDCRATAAGGRVIFEPAALQPAHVDLDWLSTRDSDYARSLRSCIACAQHQRRLDPLNSWHQVMVSASTHAQARAHALAILKEPRWQQADPKLSSSAAPVDRERAQAARNKLRQCRLVMLRTLCSQEALLLDRLYCLLHEPYDAQVAADAASVTTWNDRVVWALGRTGVLPAFLRFLDDFASPLARAKVCLLVNLVMQGPAADRLVQRLVLDRNLYALCLLARALHYFPPVPPDIWPYDSSLCAALAPPHGGGHDAVPGTSALSPALLHWVHVHYYVELIRVHVHRAADGAYPKLRKFLPAILAEVCTQLQALFSRKLGLLFESIRTGLCNRSKRVSGFVLFLLLHLMRVQHPSLQQLLRSEDAALASLPRVLADSRFRHVQAAARILFQALNRPHWYDFLCNYYSQSDRIVSDLLTEKTFSGTRTSVDVELPTTPAAAASMVASYVVSARKLGVQAPALRTELAASLCFSTLRSATLESIGLLLPPSLFSKILSALNDSANEKGSSVGVQKPYRTSVPGKAADIKIPSGIDLESVMSKGVEKKGQVAHSVLSSLLADFTKTYHALGLVVGPSAQSKHAHHGTHGVLSGSSHAGGADHEAAGGGEVSGSGGAASSGHGAGGSSMISSRTLALRDRLRARLMLTVTVDDIHTILRVLRSSNCYRTNAALLRTLRHLLKIDDIFSFVREDRSLYVTLSEYCRDGKDREFNRNAWCLFYQLVQYHNDVVAYLRKTDLLKSFMDIIGVSVPPIVIANALHYYSKLFSMVTTEERRLSQGKPARSGGAKDIKRMEKDVKLLTSYFAKQRLFVKIHMIYRRFVDSKTFPGCAFVELAHYYRILVNNPACSKLYRELAKHNPDYRDGLLLLNAMNEDSTSYFMSQRMIGSDGTAIPYSPSLTSSSGGSDTPTGGRRRSVLGRKDKHSRKSSRAARNLTKSLGRETAKLLTRDKQL